MEKNEESVATNQEPTINNYRGLKAMPFIIGNETFENLGTTGTSTNLLVYLTTVFNMKSVAAATLINIFFGTTNIATLLGGILCDTYFGRYKTLGFATIVSFAGMLVITLTAAIPKLHPPRCGAMLAGSCPGPTTGQMAFLIGGLGLLVIGAGGIRPCNLAFGADQFDPNSESGKKGISSFFNWYYFTANIAMIVSLTIVVYVQSDVDWAWGLAIPAIMMFLACVLFFMGSKIYVKLKPDGSPLKSVIQVVVAAARKRQLKLPDEPWLTLFNHVPDNFINSKLHYTNQFRFLDKAAIIADDQINSDGSSANPWRLCSIQRVEEVKCIIRVIPIWASAIIYYVALSQQQTYVVFQALQCSRRLSYHSNFEIPAASYTIFSMLGLGIWIPIYDRIIVSGVSKFTKKENGLTVLQRIGIGLFLSIVTMLLSAIVEDRRRSLALTRPISGIDSRGYAISSMSGLWLIPQLTLTGVSEAFCVIAQVEFFYTQFPENMRSISMSLSFVGVALSSYLNGLVITVVHRLTGKSSNRNWLPEDLNKGRLDYFYYFVTALGAINLVYFIICAKWFKYRRSCSMNTDVSLREIIAEHSHTGSFFEKFQLR